MVRYHQRFLTQYPIYKCRTVPNHLSFGNRHLPGSNVHFYFSMLKICEDLTSFAIRKMCASLGGHACLNFQENFKSHPELKVLHKCCFHMLLLLLLLASTCNNDPGNNFEMYCLSTQWFETSSWSDHPQLPSVMAAQMAAFEERINGSLSGKPWQVGSHRLRDVHRPEKKLGYKYISAKD